MITECFFCRRKTKECGRLGKVYRGRKALRICKDCRKRLYMEIK